MFTAIVVNSSLSIVEKLMHRRDSLSGDPLFLIRNWSVTDQNFDIAWTKIKQHYNKNRRIVYSHVSILLDIPPTKSGTSVELKGLFNATVDAVEILKSLDTPVDQWDNILISLSVRRLNQKSLLAWEDSIENSTDLSKFSDLMDFLRKMIFTLEAVQGSLFNQLVS